MALQLPCQLVTGFYFRSGINLHLKITLCILDSGFIYFRIGKEIIRWYVFKSTITDQLLQGWRALQSCVWSFVAAVPQEWHKPSGDSIEPEPVMKCSLSNASSDKDGKRKLHSVTCKLYDARGRDLRRSGWKP